MLKLNAVSHSFGDSQVLRSVSLTLSPGQRLALMGPSGKGKTTLLRAVLGLLRPDDGTVENTFRVIAYSATGLLTTASLTNAAMLLPFMGVGLFLGIRLSSRMNPRAMRLVITVMLLVSGLPLILTSL